MQNPHFLPGIQYDVQVTPLPPGIVFEQNVGVTMRDGTRLSANVFRPAGQHPRLPVIMAISPYGKDDFDGFDMFSRVPGNHIGTIRTSDHVAFEAPDPAAWVPRGYVVIQVDTRGQGQSNGDTTGFGRQEQEDYCDLIAWAAQQSWSDGNVGLNGVSYLAISQWGVAQHNPPGLKAIIPWEGWNEAYRRSYFDGIPEVGFRQFVREGQVVPHHNPACGYVTPAPGDTPADHPLYDAFWEAQEINLGAITVPALICASFSDQGLHSRDSFQAFGRIGSKQKWLYNHRQPKWHAYYSAEAIDMQFRFFDHFLKGIDNGFDKEPRVRLEINEDRQRRRVIRAATWPPEEIVPLKLFLDADGHRLAPQSSKTHGKTSYAPTEGGSAAFDFLIAEDTTIVGNARLHLWVEAVGADDMDLFVAIKKIDRNGHEVYFYGFGGVNANDVVARGWLRVSHRELDESRSTEFQPIHFNRRQLKLKPAEIVPVDVEILPSGTFFRGGERLRVVVQGVPIAPDASVLKFDRLVNAGMHVIHTGEGFDSHILLPVTPPP